MDGRRVLLVEDDPLLRDLLARALEGHGFVVAPAANAADAKRAFAAFDPDGAVVDVELGSGPTGFDLADVLRRDHQFFPIVFLTNLPDPRFAQRTSDDLPLGVAYLRKTALSNTQALLDALDHVMRGELANLPRDDRDPNRPLAGLTRKQVEVMRLVAEGRSNIQIAEIRGVTIKAVEDTVRRACATLGIDPDAEGNIRVAAARRFFTFSDAMPQALGDT